MELTFSIYGDDFNPKDFSKLIDIDPVNSWNKGDPISGTKTKRKEFAWEYSLNKDGLLLEDLTNEFLSLFSGKEKSIMEFVKTNSLSACFDLVLRFNENNIPSLVLTKEFIKLMSNLDAEMDTDIYLTAN